MKILLIDALDTADAGPWTGESWDLIIDLGKAGLRTHEQWSKRFGCEIQGLDSFRNGFGDFYQVRELLGQGCGLLVDRFGLDWWEILSILLHEELEVIILLERLTRTLGSSEEIHISRPGFSADVLHWLLKGRIKIFRPHSGTQKGLRHYLRAASRLSASQVMDVLGDKYDSSYRVRGRLARRRAASSSLVVLVPTAYVNASRTGIAYARTFSEQNFLFVNTRRSGWMNAPPPNVKMARLSSYAAWSGSGGENSDLGRRGKDLLSGLQETAEFEILQRLGRLHLFSERLQHALKVRDAWGKVLESEPVQAVLCADDSNPYTRIPLLLARERGLPGIACHHGALDARYVLKRSYGSVIWAKGEMERDYLVRKCRVPAERVEICAPALPMAVKTSPHGGEGRPCVVFFSEQYEVLGGRGEAAYRDVLPALCDLASASGRKLVVKLHPAESQRERTRFMRQILSEKQFQSTEMISGPLTEDLLAKIWCAVTVLSTVSTECAVRGIPCFLCKWLEPGGYEYVEQFVRFGAGIALHGPDEIADIPQYMEKQPTVEEARRSLWQPAEPGRLKALLESRENAAGAAPSDSPRAIMLP
ncbi:MAG TPA: hypothetical protein VND65_00765 [Candidatus Binatia bacterium]|nr:hypothetical protein [Candidatus Binatia bacterium]